MYLKWVTKFVYNPASGQTYDKLFKKLFDTEFIFLIPLDENRVFDGLNLRNMFSGDINRPCSVLEVLIALAIRCDDQIMFNDKYGKRSGRWFWEMISNMGLGRMNDNNYNEAYVNDVLTKFLYRQYDADGTGCAFRSVSHPDMRNDELWYQLNYHLGDIS